jgi:hypothetical protein
MAGRESSEDEEDEEEEEEAEAEAEAEAALVMWVLSLVNQIDDAGDSAGGQDDTQRNPKNLPLFFLAHLPQFARGKWPFVSHAAKRYRRAGRRQKYSWKES